MQSEPGLLLRKIATTLPTAFGSAARRIKRIVLGLKARFMAVARRRKKSKGGRGSGSDSEATSRFFALNPPPQTDELDRYGSSFLTPPDKPKPTGGKRKLRPRFKGRFFARLFRP